METSGCGDMVVVSGLGLGISRGCMNYGRLYQGKYIPPDRTDALIPHCEDKKIVKIEETVKEVKCNVEKSSDIDLD